MENVDAENSIVETNEVQETVKEEKVTTKKDKKPSKNKNPNSFWAKTKRFFSKLWITGFCVRLYEDMSRMRWSNKKTTLSTTGVVLSFVFLFGLCIIFFDVIISQIFKYIY